MSTNNPSYRKKLLFGCATTILLIATVELMAFFGIQISDWRSPDPSMVNSEPRTDGILIRHEEWGRERAHPYFGFNLSKQWAQGKGISQDSVNKYGLFTRHEFPVKQDDNFVIGLFGGSMANQLGSWMEGHNELLAKLLQSKSNKLKGKNIVFVNMALGASKQPQQFNILSFFIEQFDYVINLEGFNEIDAFPPDQFPIEFPYYSQILFNSSENYFGQIAKLSQFRWADEKVKEFVNWNWLFRNSNSIRFVSHYMEFWLQTQIANLARELNSGDGREGNFYGKILSLEEKKEKGALIWAKYSKLTDSLLRPKKVGYRIFIQPNQYVEGSKRLTEEEMRLAYIESRVGRTRLGYQLLREQAKQLKKEGFHVSDELLNVFLSSSDKTLYRDQCCHVNEEGNQIMALKMMEIISRDIQ